LDRTHEKVLDKIRKFKQKGQIQKAKTAVEEAITEGASGLEIMYLDVGLSLALDSWSEALRHLKTALASHELYELCRADNRPPFLKMVHEQPGFVSGLSDFLLIQKDYSSIIGWIRLSDDHDRRWLVKMWETAAEDAAPSARAANYKGAAGVALFLIDDWDGAWTRWQEGLANNPKLLKKIMAFCQGSSQMDSTRLSHRLLLIRLIAAAGKKTETLTLLKALGLENRNHAFKVLNEMPGLLPNDYKSKEALALRFSLALRLEDPELLQTVTDDMAYLGDDDLFDFKKRAMVKIQKPDLRRTVLLNFVNLYIEREEWEHAGQLLEILHAEGVHPEIVYLMEKILDRYPVMSNLHYLAGEYYLASEDLEKALHHLGTIQQVEEYNVKIRTLLEDHLEKFFDPDLAKMLLGLLNPISHRAGLVAAMILINDRDELEKHLSLWGQPLFQERASPFWYLALIHAYCRLKKYGEAYPLLCRMLYHYPDLSTEAVKSAELICNEFRRDFSEIVTLIESRAQRLQPQKAWMALQKHFQEASQIHRANLAGGHAAERAGEAIAVPTSLVEPAADMKAELKFYYDRFRGHLNAGQWAEAADIAVQAVEKFPQNAPPIMGYLDNLAKQYPRELLWNVTKIKILLKTGAYEQAIAAGQQVINSYNFQADLPEIYQQMAHAYEGRENWAEALRYYCLSCRQARFYQINRERLCELVLPKHPQFLKEVLQLVLINEDHETWRRLMQDWYKYRPDDLEHLIKVQVTFTNQAGTARAVLDLAYWRLQAGRLEDVNQTLNRVDLREPDILDHLIKTASLINLKFPDNPKPKFLLAKYYLVQKEVTKAVDTFRNLTQQVPSAAETIYHYLRTYLKKHPNNVDIISLYGLLIRLALDHGSPLASVKLLDEYGRQDRQSAESLSEGVYRVLLRKENRLEALYEFLKLLHKWRAYERLIDVDSRGDFGTHMAQQRLQWFEEACGVDGLADKANLAIARIYFETCEFDSCRRILGRLEDPDLRRDALPLYDRLTSRFPDALDLWREAGWAAFPQEVEKATKYFTHVFESAPFEIRAEAYAFLVEMGAQPDVDHLKLVCDDEDTLYGTLGSVYAHIRTEEEAFWIRKGERIPERVFDWMIETGNMDRYHTYITRIEPINPIKRALLDARALRAEGRLIQGAWRLSQVALPAPWLQSFFFDAALLERAMLVKGSGDRLPTFLRSEFLRTCGRPKIIAARFRHLCRLQDSRGLTD